MIEEHDLNLPEGMSAVEVESYLKRYVEPPKSDKEDAGEDLILDLSPDGKSISVKFSNVQFRLLDFLMGLAELGLEIFIPTRNDAKMTFAALRFIRKMWELSKVEVKPQDAEVLLALYQLQLEKQTATIDRLYEVMDQKLPVQEISESLNILEELSCIKFTDYEIILKERVVAIKK